MKPEERLERFQDLVAELVEANESSPVVVEGTRDAVALRSLGLQGEIIVYNRGTNMTNFADGLRRRRKVLVLFDWDQKGGQLTRLLREKTGDSLRLDLTLRKELARVSLVKCVEDLPHSARLLAKRARERAEESL